MDKGLYICETRLDERGPGMPSPLTDLAAAAGFHDLALRLSPRNLQPPVDHDWKHRVIRASTVALGW